MKKLTSAILSLSIIMISTQAFSKSTHTLAVESCKKESTKAKKDACVRGYKKSDKRIRVSFKSLKVG